MVTIEPLATSSFSYSVSEMGLSLPDTSGPFRAVLSKPEHSLLPSETKTVSLSFTKHRAAPWEEPEFFTFSLTDVLPVDEDLPLGLVALTADAGEWTMQVQEMVGLSWLAVRDDLLYAPTRVTEIETYSA